VLTLALGVTLASAFLQVGDRDARKMYKELNCRSHQRRDVTTVTSRRMRGKDLAGEGDNEAGRGVASGGEEGYLGI
jgi:hypothetical protein